MYEIDIEKLNTPTGPWDIFNFGFLSVVPRITLHIFFNYKSGEKNDEDNPEKRFHVATIPAHQIIADFLTRFENDFEEWNGMSERLILAGVEMLYCYDEINLSRKDLVTMVLKKFVPEKNAIIDEFRDSGLKYWLLTN